VVVDVELEVEDEPEEVDELDFAPPDVERK
jgi:hypothetical protein